MPIVECDYCGEDTEKRQHDIDRSENNYCSQDCLHEAQKNRMEVECETCGDIFERAKSLVEGYENHYCSNECKRTGRDATCDNCGEDIRVAPSNDDLKHHFCGKECMAEFRSRRVTVECAQCGEEKTVTNSRYEQYDKHFCDDGCLGKYRENGEEFSCENCSKSVYRTPSQLDKIKHDRVFCSKECYQDWNEGENNPRYNRINVGCWWCGKDIPKKPSRVKKTKRHFCDRECMGKWTTWAGRGFDTDGTPTGEYGKDMPRKEWNPDLETKEQLKRMGVYDQYVGQFE